MNFRFVIEYCDNMFDGSRRNKNKIPTKKKLIKLAQIGRARVRFNFANLNKSTSVYFFGVGNSLRVLFNQLLEHLFSLDI